MPNLAPMNLKAFRHNPYIQDLAQRAKWTVSTDDKKPVNAKELIQYGLQAGFYRTDSDLVTLAQLDADENLTYANRAYRLNINEDHLMLIDCEPTASNDIIKSLSNLPVAYAENSMHGGYHLLLPIPSNLITDENRYLFDLTAVKGPDNMFEMLLNRHFVTFTQRVLPTPQYDYQDEHVLNNIRIFLRDLVEFDKPKQAERLQNQHHQIADIDTNTPLPEAQKELLDKLEPTIKRLQEKNVTDYGNDPSKYEFAMASNCLFYASRAQLDLLDPFTGNENDPVENIKPETCMYLAYAMLKKVVPPREKHKTQRNGLPWLMYNIKRLAEMDDTIYKGLHPKQRKSN